MDLFRAIIKLIAFWLWTPAMYAAGRLVALFLPKSHYWRWRGFMFGAWARGAAQILGLRVHAQGAPPPPASVLVSNHLSYVDIIALLTRLDCAFVAKSEVAEWPLVGALCRGMDTIFVNRKQHRDLKQALGNIERMLNNGVSVIFFPEGTSTAGNDVAAFKPSLLELAANQARPAHYAALYYTTPEDEPPAREVVCWWGDMAFPPHFFNLLKLRRFDAHLAFGAQPVQAAERKELAQKLWSQVSATLTELKQTAAASGPDEIAEAIIVYE